jgi:carboxyl-terminal processing protease
MTLPFIKYLKTSFYLTIIGLTSLAPLRAQECKQLPLLWNLVDNYHVQPKALDDTLSKALFASLFDALDPHGMYFVETDMATFRKFELDLDEAIKNGDCQFITSITDVYKTRLEEVDTLIALILNAPLDYKVKEEMTFSNSIEKSVPLTIEERNKRWRKWLKYQTLSRVFTPRGEDDKPPVLDNTSFQKLEKPARNDIKIFEQKKIRLILTEFESLFDYTLNEFCKAFALYFDPHTAYYTNAEKNSFESSVSSENLSFGIEIKENDKNEIEITKLIPGGPAWKTNQLNTGDLILSARWENIKTADLSFSAINEAYNILFEKDIVEVELTIKKINGSIKKVSLEKEKLTTDENVIQSFILEGEKRIGYIFLPSFYTDWEYETNLGCANDLAKKLIVLQKENIDGLILDIRNNGGGSVKEAIDLAGIFIDMGPVTISKDRTEVSTLKDSNRGTIYNGPLIIMVNGMSASASEILSASLQDYNRALIVGATTYGKSTGQTIVPVTDNPNFNLDSYGKYGYLKLTGSIFYRITNKTHQEVGVVPDVILPDLYDHLEFREKFENYVLKADSISKKTYYTPFNGAPKGDLQELSTLRIRDNAYFKNVVNISDSVKMIYNREFKVPLDFEGYKKSLGRTDYNWQEWEKMLIHPTTLFTVNNDVYTKEIIKIDEYNRDINQFQIENIQNDIYIEETYQIMLDFINLEK